MSEKTTFACDNCECTITSKLLPAGWDYVNISSMRGGYRETMHLCVNCLKLMGETGSKSLIRRIIEVARKGTHSGL